MSLKHIEISGDHYEIGVALGKLASDAIREVVPKIESVKLLRSLWLGSDRLSQIEAMARAQFPLYMREMDGIADGAGVPLEDILIWNCRGDLPLEAVLSSESGIGCTTVMTNPGSGGTIRIVHNEDGHEALHGKCTMVTLHPTKATSITGFYYPGIILGHNFGLNEYGLVQTVDNISPHDKKIGVPRHIVSRASLACPSLDEAVSIFKRRDRASGFHYAIAKCGDNRLLSVEAPASNCIVREVKGRTVHTNHLIFDELQGADQTIGVSSKYRLEKAEELVNRTSAEPVTALSILGNDDNKEFPICIKQNKRKDFSYTLATAEFEITDTGCNWAVYDNPNGKPVLSGHQPQRYELSDKRV